MFKPMSTAVLFKWVDHCRGPNAREPIAVSEQLGWVLFELTVVVALGAVALGLSRRMLRRQSIVVVGLAALQPGWWMSARHGDCGDPLRWCAEAVGVAALVVFVWAIAELARARTPTETTRS